MTNMITTRGRRMPENGLRVTRTPEQGGKSFCNASSSDCKGNTDHLQTPGNIIFLSNEADQLPNGENIIGFANEFTILQRDNLTVPYGDQEIVVNGKKYLQRLTLEAANAMVQRFNSFRGKATRRFGGLPFFVGHPDDVNFANQHKDTKAYGWIMELAAKAGGLDLAIKWSDAGNEMLSNAYYKFFSPRWKAEIGGMANGLPIATPVWLTSAGLTNNPNWPVCPLANEHKQNEGNISMELLQRLIAIIGVEAGTSEDDIVMAVTNLVTAARKIREAMEAKWDAQDASHAALPNEMLLDEVVGKVLALSETDAKALANEIAAHVVTTKSLTDQGVELKTATDNFATERGIRIEACCNEWITDGKILLANKEAVVVELKADFDGKVAAMANATPVIKVKTKVNETILSNETMSVQEKILHLVNEKHATVSHLPRHDAYMMVKRENPALFKTAEESTE